VSRGHNAEHGNQTHVCGKSGICEIVFGEGEGNLFLEKIREKIDALNMYLSTIIL